MKTKNFPAKRALRQARAMGMDMRLPTVEDQRHRCGRPYYDRVVRELRRGWSAFEQYGNWNPVIGYAPKLPDGSYLEAKRDV